jgi:hypothetical protein
MEVLGMVWGLIGYFNMAKANGASNTTKCNMTLIL